MNNIGSNVDFLAQPPRSSTLGDNPPGKNTTHSVSVVPQEQVSPLLTLPNELLFSIASYLTGAEFISLGLTCRRLNIIFSTEEQLKILSVRYYGSAAGAYREIIENLDIPAIRYLEIKDPLLRLTRYRHTNTEFLITLGGNARQSSETELNGHNEPVTSVTTLADGRLASCSADRTVNVWDLSQPRGQQCVAKLRGHH